MKKYATSVMLMLMAIIFLNVSPAFSQNFEGKVTYNITVKGNIGDLSAEQITTMMGDKMEYYIKGGNYKNAMSGKIMQWQIYVNKDNKLYEKHNNSDTILWTDCTTNQDSIINIELNKNAGQILGYICDEIVVTTMAGVQKYYFNAKLGIDTSLFERHKYNSWDEYVKLAKAVPLKFYLAGNGITFECTATKIQPMKLDDKVFQLPADAVYSEKN